MTSPRTQQDLARLRTIPSVESLLSSPEGRELTLTFGRPVVVDTIRSLLKTLRETDQSFSSESFHESLHRELTKRATPSLRSMINATGVLIHTNMGRAPLSTRIWDEASELMGGFTNLELDQQGARGSRQSHLTSTCQTLFGAEAALLVNNNAAAVMLVLAALAESREVIVSRGELVEIGGSFRIPDVIERGGAILREVGTTNRTRVADYESAINDQTGAILSVHQSNFRIVGFSEQATDQELSLLAGKNGVSLVIDEGSGRVVPLDKWGLEKAPTVAELVEHADVVTCSTDKLIGASQGGLILGSANAIDRCVKHPLMRALRPGKESIAIVTATLGAFTRETHETDIPLYRLLSTPLESLRGRAESIVEKSGARASIIETRAKLGGGTTPEETVESLAISLDGSPEPLRRHLLSQGLVGRIEKDNLLLDLRSVSPEEDALITRHLIAMKRSA